MEPLELVTRGAIPTVILPTLVETVNMVPVINNQNHMMLTFEHYKKHMC